MNDDELSHGFLSQLYSKSTILSLRHLVSTFLAEHDDPEYVSNVHIELPEIHQLINIKLKEKLSILLGGDRFQLMNVEIHNLKSGSDAIPPHQDNFYHCISEGLGIKILIPLSSFDTGKGGLIFYDVPISFQVLPHLPSERKHFSSYICKSHLKNLEAYTSAYEYCEGDATYHYLNSIHYSLGNTSNEDSVFIVLRFHNSLAVESSSMQKAYQKCYEKHINQL